MSWYEYTGAVQGGGFGPDDDERRRRRRHARDSVAYTGGRSEAPRATPGVSTFAPTPGVPMPARSAEFR